MASPPTDNVLRWNVILPTAAIICFPGLLLVLLGLACGWWIAYEADKLLQSHPPAVHQAPEGAQPSDPAQRPEQNLGVDAERLRREFRQRLWRAWAIFMLGATGILSVTGWIIYRRAQTRARQEQVDNLARVKQYTDLGRLVGGLAHEIRNPLNAIRLNLHAIRRLREGHATLTEEEVELAFEGSTREIERLDTLMQTLLGYARPGNGVLERVDVTEELTSLAAFLTPALEKAGVQLHLDLAPPAVMIRIDPDRLRQLLLNLMNNARDAAGRNGTIWLSTTVKNSEVHIRVEDDGHGVDPADRQRIFEPFCSGRDTGTGLGLTLVKRYVEEVNGTIICTDSVQGGACFEVVLPIDEPAPPAPPRPESTVAHA